MKRLFDIIGRMWVMNQNINADNRRMQELENDKRYLECLIYDCFGDHPSPAEAVNECRYIARKIGKERERQKKFIKPPKN